MGNFLPGLASNSIFLSFSYSLVISLSLSHYCFCLRACKLDLSSTTLFFVVVVVQFTGAFTFKLTYCMLFFVLLLFRLYLRVRPGNFLFLSFPLPLNWSNGSCGNCAPSLSRVSEGDRNWLSSGDFIIKM